jgi:hypothetical protein
VVARNINESRSLESNKDVRFLVEDPYSVVRRASGSFVDLLRSLHLSQLQWSMTRELVAFFRHYSSVAVLDDSQVPGSAQTEFDLSKCVWAWWALVEPGARLLALR